LRFVTFENPGGGGDRVGVVEGDMVFAFDHGTTLRSLLAEGGPALLEAGNVARRDPAVVMPCSELRLRAPVPVPPSIRDFLAFETHVRNARGGEVDADWFELPVFYFSNPAAVHGPEDDVPVFPGSTMFDFELEVAAVVGTEGSNLTPDAAEDHIAGYTVLCDFSARDIQRREMRQQLGPAKGKDGATSLGPCLVTSDELEPYRSRRAFALEMTVTVNGRRYGGGRLDEIYWSFAEMLAYASRGTRVVPGDVIGSGTVGTGCILELAMMGRGEEFPWLVPGDVVELHVEQLGTLRHTITVPVSLHELTRRDAPGPAPLHGPHPSHDPGPPDAPGPT
jgi:2-keto-4-pentenoate hydratase/2-oxohepta-3-ene-1,7-dioic acid hydratase in catechol pathway